MASRDAYQNDEGSRAAGSDSQAKSLGDGPLLASIGSASPRGGPLFASSIPSTTLQYGPNPAASLSPSQPFTRIQAHLWSEAGPAWLKLPTGLLSFWHNLDGAARTSHATSTRLSLFHSAGRVCQFPLHCKFRVKALLKCVQLSMESAMATNEVTWQCNQDIIPTSSLLSFARPHYRPVSVPANTILRC